MAKWAEIYATVVDVKDAHSNNRVYFIECIRILRLRTDAARMLQRSKYSGHKEGHCLSYQNHTTTDGDMFYVRGLDAERRKEEALFRERSLEETMETVLLIIIKQYRINGGPAYLPRP